MLHTFEGMSTENMNQQGDDDMKIVKIKSEGNFCWTKKGDTYRCNAPVSLLFEAKDAFVFKVTFYSGAKTDGLSVPKIFRWFLKSWDDKRPLYDLVGATHDAMYATKGFNGMFTRSECDDFLGGGLRCVHVDRKRASIADLVVGLFAKSHWGSDSKKLSEHCKITVLTRDHL